jgi:hypothetical protein
MNNIEISKFRRLIEQLNVPVNITIPTPANFRWLLRNAWIENRQNPNLHELLRLIRPHA